MLARNNPDFDKILLTIEISEGGWAYLTLRDAENEETLRISHIFDGIERLVTAILLLNKGIQTTECTLFSEPGGYYILFERKSPEIVTIKIYETERWTDMPLKDVIHKSTTLFITACKLKQLNNQFINALHTLLQEYSIEEYKRRWHNEFPTRKYAELQQFVKTDAQI